MIFEYPSGTYSCLQVVNIELGEEFLISTPFYRSTTLAAGLKPSGDDDDDYLLNVLKKVKKERTPACQIEPKNQPSYLDSNNYSRELYRYGCI